MTKWKCVFALNLHATLYGSSYFPTGITKSYTHWKYFEDM